MRLVSELDREEIHAPDVDVRSVGIDDYAHVRYIHATAFRLLAAPFVEPDEAARLADRFYDADYTQSLMSEDLCAAWIDGEMVGTAGWVVADDRGDVARITSVFVRPLFTRLGIGRRLVEEAEARARRRGYGAFAVRATSTTATFFEQLGYEVSSHGALPLLPDRGMPVTYLRKVLAGEVAIDPTRVQARLSAPSSRAVAAPRPARRVDVADILATASQGKAPRVKYVRR